MLITLAFKELKEKRVIFKWFFFLTKDNPLQLYICNWCIYICIYIIYTIYVTGSKQLKPLGLKLIKKVLKAPNKEDF